MNIINGIDRIALLIAVIAIIPGILTGTFLIYDNFKTISPENEAKYQAEYKSWMQSGSTHNFNMPKDKYDPLYPFGYGLSY